MRANAAPPVEPSARDDRRPRGAASDPPAYDDLRADEVIALLPSLDEDALRAPHAHETANRGGRTVISAIERLQRWEAQP